MTTFTIGRSNESMIQIADATKTIGNHHANILVDDNRNAWIERVKFIINAAGKKETRNYTVYVQNFMVNRKRIGAMDEINLGGQHRFYLHHYFEMDGDKIVRRRDGSDFTSEMKKMEGRWKSLTEHKKAIGQKSNLFTTILAVIIWLFGLGAFFFTGNIVYTLVAGLVGSLPMVVRTHISNFVSEKKEEASNLVKDTNKCPLCWEYMEGTWEQIKDRGYHNNNCKARWKL